MFFKFTGNFEAPLPYEIVYDKVGKRLFTARREENAITEDLFYVISPNVRFRLSFNVRDGRLTGLVYSVELDKLPQGDIEMPCSADGCVVADSGGCQAVCGCFYAAFKSPKAVYDAKRNIVFFGDADGNAVTFRVLKNMCVSLGINRDLRGIYILL